MNGGKLIQNGGEMFAPATGTLIVGNQGPCSPAPCLDKVAVVPGTAFGDDGEIDSGAGVIGALAGSTGSSNHRFRLRNGSHPADRIHVEDNKRADGG